MFLAHVFSAIDLCRHFSKKATLLLSDSSVCQALQTMLF